MTDTPPMSKEMEWRPLCETCCKRVDSVNEADMCEDCQDKWEAQQIAYWRPLYLGEKLAGLLATPNRGGRDE